MNIGEKLTGEKFNNLLLQFYQKGVEARQVDTNEFINEIAHHMMLAMNETTKVVIQKSE